MEPEGSLPCALHPTTDPYPELDKSNTLLPMLVHFNIILQSMPKSSELRP
jgi:hypothetical protein